MKFLLVVLLLVAIASACDKWDKNVDTFCKFGSESKPCLQEANVASEKQSCCARGCSFAVFQKDKVCCFSDACLARCYPGKGYKTGQVY